MARIAKKYSGGHSANPPDPRARRSPFKTIKTRYHKGSRSKSSGNGSMSSPSATKRKRVKPPKKNVFKK